ncbi:ArnT family glycosyltransferase [Thiomicrospira cyclica]|uniref:Glycosyl transferase family 39 n=1 Tax=Thiomicrospira cyclica (strain DSM 14477 / JCM 11371 / ALM1) TaxID=717773 RepID=F6DA50_THICA|nr:glycosyltransferase family 39 protein [Thiomicrospira cyclica]AEG32181.1 glycosyl transferase family 39 [Thiomicrospira cyclica ALM1]
MFVLKQDSNFKNWVETFLLGESPYSRLLVAFIVGLIAVLYLWPALQLPLFDMDEGAYAAVSREMVLSGQWWATMLNGEPFFHKPVLMYWLQALGLAIVGDGSFAYRLSSLVALGLWLWATFVFVERHIDRETAWYTLWIAMFSSGIVVVFKAAIPDAWLILFISLAIYRGLDFLSSAKAADLNWAFVWTGFATLAKGPIGLVVVAGTFFIYLILTKNWQKLKEMLLAWQGWLLLALISLPWYILQFVLFGQDFINEFFGVHNVGRFMSPMEGHGGTPLYYIVALVILTLPFFPLLVRSILPWWRWSKAEELAKVLAIWFLLVIIFFTLAATKLPHYLMYGIPPVIIAIAYCARQHGTRWGLGLTLIVVALVLTSVPWLIELSMQQEKNPYLVDTFGLATELVELHYFIWMLVLGLAGLWLVWAKWGSLAKIVFSGILMTLVLNYAVLDYAAELQQKPIVEAAEFVKSNQLEVVTCCIEMPSFNVVAQQLTPVRMPQAGEVVFGKTYELEQRFTQVEWLWQGRGVSVARVLKE